MHSMTASDAWNRAYAAIEAEWSALQPGPIDVAAWEADLDAVETEYHSLIAAGDWLSGRRGSPVD